MRKRNISKGLKGHLEGNGKNDASSTKNQKEKGTQE